MGRFSKIIATLFDKNCKVIDAGNPLPTSPNGRVNAFEIDQDVSTKVGFDGTWEDFFDNLQATNTNTSATNPKVIDIYLREINYSISVGLTGSFKNCKITSYIGSIATVLLDQSADATARTVVAPEFEAYGIERVMVEFYTADTITIDTLDITSAVTTASQIRGLDPDGNPRTAGVTEDGYLSVSDTSDGLAIAEGEVAGKTFIHKFGEAPDFDSGDGWVTIYDGANDALFAGAPPMNPTDSTTADIGTISSSSAADTVDILIKGPDTNGIEVTQTVTLTGQTDVSLSTNLKDVARMKNVGATDLVGQVYLRVNGTGQALGVPSAANSVRAIINGDNNQTLMATYVIPSDKTGYVRDFYFDIVDASKASNYKVRVRAKEPGGVYRSLHVKGLAATGTSSVQHIYVEPEVLIAETKILLQVMTTDSPITGANISGGFDIVLVDN